MSPDSYSTRIASLIEEANHRPRLFTARIIASGLMARISALPFLARLNFGPIIATVLLAPMLIGIFLFVLSTFGKTILIAVALGLLALYIITSIRRVNDIVVPRLSRTAPPPPGVLLPYGALHTLVDELAAQLGAPHITGIVVVDAVDAGTVDVDIKRFRTWRATYMVIGLPLLLMTSPEQFRGLIAQRLALRTGSLRTLQNYIVAAGDFLQRTASRFMQGNMLGRHDVMRLNDYWTFRLRAHFIAAGMINTIRADEKAASLVGARVLADGLLNQRLAQLFLMHNFWPELHRMAEQYETPPFAPYGRMHEAFAAMNRENAKVMISEAMLMRTITDDGSPPLADRMGVLREQAYPPDTITLSAADHYLGEAVTGLTERYDREWMERQASPWEARHHEYSRALEKMNALEQQQQEGTQLTEDERVQLAQLYEVFRTPADALHIYQELLHADPAQTDAAYSIGRIMLEEGDINGIAMIEQAIEKDAKTYLVPGVELVRAFLARRGRSMTIEQFLDTYSSRYSIMKVQQQEDIALARKERSKLSFNDHYIEHALPEPALEQLRTLLASFPEIRIAYLVRKYVEHIAEIPLFVLGVLSGYPAGRTLTDYDLQELLDQIDQQTRITGQFTIVSLSESRNVPMHNIMLRVPHSMIYQQE